MFGLGHALTFAVANTTSKQQVSGETPVRSQLERGGLFPRQVIGYAGEYVSCLGDKIPRSTNTKLSSATKVACHL